MPQQVQVRVSGPLFTGQATKAVTAFLDEAKFEVAAQALSQVQEIHDRSIRDPTPYYETQIMVERQRNDWVVHDRGIVYGPWLEGTSSRNQTTRFKGYHAFRDATRRVEKQAGRLVEHLLRRHLSRMG